MHNFEEATRAYSHAMTVLNHYLLTNAAITSQHGLLAIPRRLIPSSTFASDAAYAAVKAEDPMRAVELLEHGRGLLWSQLKHYQYLLD